MKKVAVLFLVGALGCFSCGEEREMVELEARLLDEQRQCVGERQPAGIFYSAGGACTQHFFYVQDRQDRLWRVNGDCSRGELDKWKPRRSFTVSGHLPLCPGVNQ